MDLCIASGGEADVDAPPYYVILSLRLMIGEMVAGGAAENRIQQIGLFIEVIVGGHIASALSAAFCHLLLHAADPLLLLLLRQNAVLDFCGIRRQDAPLHRLMDKAIVQEAQQQNDQHQEQK